MIQIDGQSIYLIRVSQKFEVIADWQKIRGNYYFVLYKYFKRKRTGLFSEKRKRRKKLRDFRKNSCNNS